MRIDDEDDAGDEERVAIRRSPRCRFGSDDCAAARAVLDHHRHALGAADLLAQHAGDDVGGAARRIRIDDLDRCGLRQRALAEREESESG